MCESGLGWGSLPAEALFGIYTALDFTNVSSCAVVCKHWKCVSDAPLLWRQFLRDVSEIAEAELPSTDAKVCLVRLVTSRLYTWGGKVLDFPGTTTRNRLTSPTLIPATILSSQRDPDAYDVFPTGLLASELSQRHVDARKVVAGEDFGVLLSWGGKVIDTRSYDRDLGDRVVISRAHLFPRWWSPPGERVSSVAAGGGGGTHGGHVLAVTASGKVWSWGGNAHGQLGLGTIDKFVHDPSKAFEVEEGRSIVGAACGKHHSVVWSTDGQLYACGDNSKGACAMGPDQELVPVFLEVGLAGVNVLEAACGDANTIICGEDGGVWVSGDNAHGQCGAQATRFDGCFEFVKINPGTAWNAVNKAKVKETQQLRPAKVAQVAASSATLYVLTSSGEVFAWGRGSQGELGTGGASKFQPNPAKLPWATRINNICGSAGGRFAAAVDVHGRLYTWGEGKFGQLGHGDTNKRTTGRAVKSLYGSEVVGVACGSDFMMGITSWKLGSKHKTLKANSMLNPSNSELREFTPSRSMEDEILASSCEGSFKYIEIEPAFSSSPMSFSPGFSPGYVSRRTRKPRRNQLPLGLECGAASLEGEASDLEFGYSPGSLPARNPSRKRSSRVRNDAASSPGNQAMNSSENVPAGAIPIPVSSNRPSLDRGSEEIPTGKRNSKSEKKFHAMLRRQVKALANDPSVREMFFPADLNSSDRYKVHQAAERCGLLHESVGEEPQRQIRIWKPLMRKASRGAPMADIQAPGLNALKRCDGQDQDTGVFETAMEL